MRVYLKVGDGCYGYNTRLWGPYTLWYAVNKKLDHAQDCESRNYLRGIWVEDDDGGNERRVSLAELYALYRDTPRTPKELEQIEAAKNEEPDRPWFL